MDDGTKMSIKNNIDFNDALIICYITSAIRFFKKVYDL